MGAPKQKWTAEEEAALKAGVVKHGAGKWRTILMDPEFSAILRMRSNVDLKDKWRNINVTAIWGSRQKAKLALKKNQLMPKLDGNALALATVRSDEEVVDAKPLAISGGPLSSGNSKERMKRLDALIMEAITNLKEPSGSDRAAIAAYIEDQYWAPPNFKKLISAKLKLLIANGKLIKVKHRYRIAANSRTAESRKGTSKPHIEGRPKDSPKSEKRELKIFTKSQIDAKLSKMRSMTAQEAAAAAARAVAEAEVAIAEAEEAAREAEAAEAEAEAAQVFAQAAFNALKCRATIQTCPSLPSTAVFPPPPLPKPRLERYNYSILCHLKMGLDNYDPAVIASPSSSSTAGKSSSSSPGAAAEEKMVFDVKLEKYDPTAKIKVIKEVRGFTDLGLKEAKDLVEKVPAVVKKGVTKEEGNAILDKLKQLGATVVLE